jgi:hypothetical protein
VGKHVSLLVVPAADVWSAIVQTANNLDSSAVVLGLSSKMLPAEQALAMGHSWEGLPEPKRQFVLQIVHPEGKVDSFRIGPHTPTMMNEDVLLLHRLWLNITREPGLENVHHHEILTEALTRFAHDYAARDRQEIIKELRRITADGSSMPRRSPGHTLPMQAEPTQDVSDKNPPTAI